MMLLTDFMIFFLDYEVTWDEGSSTMSSIHKLTNAAHDGQVRDPCMY